MNINLINKMVDQGYISKKKHPKHDLYILNYTSKAQIERVWNAATIMCRGLIVDLDWNIVGHPLKKFFTLDQFVSIRNYVHQLYGVKFKEFYSKLHSRPFRAFDKLDGSMGVIFFNRGANEWQVASRGSFTSVQAQEANRILADSNTNLDLLKQGKTYIVEIIYPGNRIVVDYGTRRGLTLLAVVDNKTGADDWDEFKYLSHTRIDGFSGAVEFTELNYMGDLESYKPDDREGFVLVFDDGFRLKFKFDEYLRLHRILTCITKRNVWERLRDGEGFLEWMKDVPDEFYKWIIQTKLDLRLEYAAIEDEAMRKLEDAKSNHPSRFKIAEYIKDYKYKSICFKMLDGGDYSKIIWKLIKPASEKPFALGDN